MSWTKGIILIFVTSASPILMVYFSDGLVTVFLVAGVSIGFVYALCKLMEWDVRRRGY